jgi:hypothetical protein
VEFRHFAVDVHDAAEIGRPAGGDQVDQRWGIGILAWTDQWRLSQKTWMRFSPSSGSSSAVTVLIHR